MAESYHMVPDPDSYGFKRDLEFLCFNGCFLEGLHLLHEPPPEVVTFWNDNTTWWHQQIYAKLNTGGLDGFLKNYRRLIREVVVPIVGEEVCFQARPTFRIHVPGNMSVGEFHRDGDYNHPPHEINFILPLTNGKDTNSVWAESEPGSGDFHPFSMQEMTLIKFDGNRCLHGNKVSCEGTTRVSIDFRVIPLRLYNPEWSLVSTGVGKRFVVGDYYDVLKEEEQQP